MEGKNVAAVVLTYNRLPLLKECIAAIKNQTAPPDVILAIDNGSEADTGAWLQNEAGVTHIHILDNVGPAAGMKRGLQEAYERGYEWIWVMDDDGLPHPEALEKLVKARPEVEGAKNSLVLDKLDKKTLVFRLLQFKTVADVKKEFVEGEIMPWNGTLFHRRIIKELGLPKGELFLWGEETEYYYRIKTSGLFDLFTVRDSHHYHPRNEGLFYKGTWDVKSNWRAYYFIRNKYAVYLSRHRQNRLHAGLHYLLFNAGMIYYIIRGHTDKIKKIKLTLQAMSDGFLKNYTRPFTQVADWLQTL